MTAPAGPMRAAICCGKTDTDPKHGIAQTPEVIVYHHVDCGPFMDPPCGTADPDMHMCTKLRAGYEGESGDGDAMRAHVQERAAELAELEQAGQSGPMVRIGSASTPPADPDASPAIDPDANPAAAHGEENP